MTLEKYLCGLVSALSALHWDSFHLMPTVYDQYLELETPHTDQALAVWQNTAKYYKTSYLAWSKYSELLMYVTHVRILLQPLLTSLSELNTSTYMPAHYLRTCHLNHLIGLRPFGKCGRNSSTFMAQ